jgi:hypothetical protein
MNDELAKEISNINANIAIMPHKTIKDKKKYQEYLNDVIKENTVKQNAALQEITRRYNELIKAENPQIAVLASTTIDIKELRKKNDAIPLINRLGLDSLFYQLKHFYKDDLSDVNTVIINIIKVFNKYGVNLTTSDFKYSNYVSSYLNLLMNDSKNVNKIHNYFDSIYWKCPMIIKAIELNFEYLFIKYQNDLSKALEEHNDNFDGTSYLNKYLYNLNELRTMKNSDYGYILNKFLNKKLILSDYNEASITKLKQNILLDENDPHNNSNLSKLCSTLDEYKRYIEYKFIIDDVMTKYLKKEENKGNYSAKLKEISKQEAKLFSLNKKLNATGLFKLRESKKEQVNLEINNIINSLDTMYDELNDLRIDDAIYNNLSDESKMYDVLFTASNDYNYFVKLLKVQDENVTIDIINNRLLALYNYLVVTDFDIINNVVINSDINIAQMVVDRYKLVNLNITEDSISADNIDATIKNIKTLLNYYAINNVGLDYAKLHFILDCKKILTKE